MIDDTERIPTEQEMIQAAEVLEHVRTQIAVAGPPPNGATADGMECVARVLRGVAPIVGQFGPIMASGDAMAHIQALAQKRALD